jgi:Ca2+-binding EF-hand superfamily protein
MKVLALAIGCCAALSIALAQAPSKQAPTKQDNPPAANKAPVGNHQPDARNAPRFDAARFLKDHDTNNDGKLSRDELPPRMQKEFTEIDTNKDGFISLDELQQHADRMAQRRPQLIEVVFYAVDIPEEAVTRQELQEAYDLLRKLDK